MINPTRFSPFEGQVCLVTGAAGAIGGAAAQAFAAEGASLFLVDREPAPDEGLSAGPNVAWARTDVARPREITAAVDQALARFGRIDILVNVAGTVSHGAAKDLALAEWDRVLEINLRGTFLFCQAVIPIMQRQQYGRIVNLGSVLGANGGNPRPWIDPAEQERAGNVAYGVSKAGVQAMTGYLAKELAADGITVNSVAPGPVATGMTTSLPETLRALIPVGRMANPDEIAHAILYLASPQSGFVTGEVLDVNGGLTVG